MDGDVMLVVAFEPPETEAPSSTPTATQAGLVNPKIAKYVDVSDL